MTDTLRYELDDPEIPQFAGTFIEFSKSWTRRELRDWANAESDTFLDMLHRKVVALRVGHITEPSQITDDALDDLDNRLFEWFTMVVGRARWDVLSLGEAFGRRVLGISEEAETETTTAQDNPQTN